MSLSGRHKDQDLQDGIHVVPSWSYADATARTTHAPTDGAHVDPNNPASAFLPLVPSDVYKFAIQLDDNSVWMLLDDDPITWRRIDGVGVLSSVFTVPGGVNVGDFVYITGSFAADVADNTDPAKNAVGIVDEKPSGTTALVSTVGEQSGLSGMTPGADQFLGASGARIESGALPIAPGSVVQLLGQAVSASTILMGLRQGYVL